MGGGANNKKHRPHHKKHNKNANPTHGKQKQNKKPKTPPPHQTKKTQKKHKPRNQVYAVKNLHPQMEGPNWAVEIFAKNDSG